MKQGNWFGNFFTWLFGYIVMYLYLAIGYILGIFGAWQFGADGVLQTLTDFILPEIKNGYMDEISLPDQK